MSDWSPVWYWESEVPSQICDYIIKLSEKNEYEIGKALQTCCSKQDNAPNP